MKLSHIAIACPQIVQVANRLKTLGLVIKERHEVPSEKVSAAMIPVETSEELRIELLEPTSPDSPVSKFLTRRPQGGLHHLSFEVDNIKAWYDALITQGIEVLPPGIRKAARGSALFIHPKEMGGCLVELEQIQRS